MKFVISDRLHAFLIVVSCTKDADVQLGIVGHQFHNESCNCPRHGHDLSLDNTLQLFNLTIEFGVWNFVFDRYNSKVITSMTLYNLVLLYCVLCPPVSLTTQWS